MASIIQIRRDSAANWTSTNPVLASGELGTETDTSKLKIGDGTTAWTSLAYYTLGLTGYVIGTDVQAYDATIMVDADIGSTVQAYDADTTKNDVANTFTATQTLPAVKITTGAGAAKVLTSDAAGLATWETADQTGAEIKTAYEGETNAFTDTQFTKLGGIEASADVTDTTNVTAAGALMDSELADIAAVKAYTGIPDTNITYTTATRVIASSTGTDATLPRAGTTTDGLMRARLNGTTAYLTYNGTTA